MAEGVSKKILASIRYYGDEKNRVHLVDPVLIHDFVSKETFNLDVPHLIDQIKNGERIAEPVQVFAISRKKYSYRNIHPGYMRCAFD